MSRVRERWVLGRQTSEFVEGSSSSSGVEVVSFKDAGGSSAAAKQEGGSGVAMGQGGAAEESSFGGGSDDDLELGHNWEDEVLEDLLVESLPLVHGQRLELKSSLCGVEPWGLSHFGLFHPKPRQFNQGLYFATRTDAFAKQNVKPSPLRPEHVDQLREMPYMTMPCKYNDRFWRMFKVAFDIPEGYDARLPEAGEYVFDHPEGGWVGINVCHLKAGLRFPLH